MQKEFLEKDTEYHLSSCFFLKHSLQIKLILELFIYDIFSLLKFLPSHDLIHYSLHEKLSLKSLELDNVLNDYLPPGPPPPPSFSLSSWTTCITRCFAYSTLSGGPEIRNGFWSAKSLVSLIYEKTISSKSTVNLMLFIHMYISRHTILRFTRVLI